MGDVFRKQLLTLCNGDAATTAVVGQLVAVDAANGEIAGLRMADEEAADGRRGLYRVMVGEGDAQLSLRVQTVDDDTLQRMVRTGGIAEGDSENVES